MADPLKLRLEISTTGSGKTVADILAIAKANKEVGEEAVRAAAKELEAATKIADASRSHIPLFQKAEK
jgi:hypothetical protein